MDRIYHTWDKWECYPAGFYEDVPPEGMSKTDAELSYARFLGDDTAFSAAAARVLAEWPRSCEHYLSNANMNRIAWIGQASACIALGIPAAFRGGFNRLSAEDQERANTVALNALNTWLTARGEPVLTLEGATSRTLANLY